MTQAIRFLVALVLGLALLTGVASVGVKVVDTFPADSHPPIVYPFALTASSKNPAAGEFLDFLQGAEATKVFEAEGFTVLR